MGRPNRPRIGVRHGHEQTPATDCRPPWRRVSSLWLGIARMCGPDIGCGNARPTFANKKMNLSGESRNGDSGGAARSNPPGQGPASPETPRTELRGP